MRSFFAVAALVLFCSPAGAAPKKPKPQLSISGKFSEVDQLASEQKFQAALEKTQELVKKAQSNGEDALLTEALVKATQLEMALHGYETAVRYLKDSQWPKDGSSRVLLQLFYGYSLMNYQQNYGWEIGKREKTVSSEKVDLKAWTNAQIGHEIAATFDAAMADGPWLELAVPEFFKPYVTENTYPPGVRPTLRDALTYLTVQFLANSQYWSPKESNETFRLPVARLANGEISKRIPAASEAAHPIEKISSWLSELERIHQAKGRGDASLEAHYVLIETLHTAFTEAKDKTTVLLSLRTFQKSSKKAATWWSRGQALLATLIQQEDLPGKLIDARAEAKLGQAAFEGSPGARMCASIIAEIERADIAVSAMASDANEKRSILLSYRNTKKVFFRAYPVSLEEALHRSPNNNGFLAFDHQKTLELLRSGVKPVAAWAVDLPATPDFSMHRKFVTPPNLKKGIYEIASSLGEDFSEQNNAVIVSQMIVSDLVLTMKRLSGDKTELRAVSGTSGKPMAGVKISLYSFTYQSAPAEASSRETDANGYAVFSKPVSILPNSYPNYFFLARTGSDIAAERENIWFGADSEEAEMRSSFVYTDRSIYRPQQKIHYKVVAFHGRSSEGTFKAANASETVQVQLMDPNYQAVGTTQVKLNSFGSGSGEFLVPAGRPLGNWHIQVGNSYPGSASLKVEEYKRPTFEANFKEASEALRLNQKARLTGEAKYYFGLPVTAGAVKWRVTREEVTPWWWSYWGWFNPRRQTNQSIAAGTAELKKDGTFSIEFTAEADERKSADKSGVSYNFHVEADVTDEGGETRTASRNFRLGFVAVETKLDWENGFFTANKASQIQAKLTNLDGKPLKGQGHYRINALNGGATVLPSELPIDPTNSDQPVYRARSRGAKALRAGTDSKENEYSTEDDKTRSRWETEFRWETVTKTWDEAAKVAEGTVEHDDKGEGKIPVTGLAPGVYRVQYSTKDSFGAEFEVSRDFLVGAAAASNVNLPLVLEAENDSRKVGEIARLLVHSGLKDQPLAVEVFRGGKRISRTFFTSGKSSDLLEIPVKLEDRGGFTVVVSGVRDHQKLRSETTINVPWSDRELKVEFSTFRDKLKPGAKETFQISVKSDKGHALEHGGAEVLAYMYDRSLDFFGPHTPPNTLSIYPSRAGAPADSFSIGPAPVWTVINNLPTPPSPPTYAPDRLNVYPKYGIGGPGRHRMGYAAAEGGMAMMNDSAAMAPQASMAKGMAASGGAPRELEQAKDTATGASLKKSENANVAAKTEAPQATEMRSNFSESAFFAPHLVLGANGTASVEFTAPDSVTSWKVLAHALTKDLRGGSVVKEARTVKELMVRPYAPRFLREGDEAEIKVQVNNAGENAFSGELTFDIEDGAGKSALAEFGLKGEAKKPFTVPKGGSVTLGFPLHAPKKVGDYAFKVQARTKGFSDGERRPFPMLPSRMHLAQSRFVTLHHKDSKTLEFKDLAAGGDPTLINEQMVVTVDAQLFYGVLQALPYLVKYPYECVEQTLNRFLSTGIVSSIFGKFPATKKMAEELSKRKTQLEAFDEPDANRKMALEETPWLQESKGGSAKEDDLLNMLNPTLVKAERDDALNKLQKMQLADGGFPWFQGGPADEHMTLYILLSLTRALEFKIDIPQDMVYRGWQFVKGWLDGHLDEMIAKDHGWEEITMINFALSGYPSDQWTGINADYKKKLLEFSFKHWKEHAPLVKGYLALTLKRMDRAADAKLVWDSVMDSAKHSDELGTYWAREDRSWLWYNDEIETHAFALRTQMELDAKDKHNEGIVQWLFLNKKLNHWKSTRATAEVIYALTHYLDKTAALGVKEEIKVELGSQTTEFKFDPDKYTGKKNQIVVPGEKVDAKAMSKIVVSKSTPGFAFASATWQFSTDKLPTEDRGDFFSVSRKYFRREHVGSEWRLVPLADGAKVSVGDQIEVQLSLRTKHEAEYVHLRDPRGAGFEPENVNSGYKWDLGISWYEETRDSGSNFFFSWLPVGEYTFKYRLRANMNGNFRVGPATVQSMYAPEFNAYSAGNMLRVE